MSTNYRKVPYFLDKTNPFRNTRKVSTYLLDNYSTRIFQEILYSSRLFYNPTDRCIALQKFFVSLLRLYFHASVFGFGFFFSKLSKLFSKWLSGSPPSPHHFRLLNPFLSKLGNLLLWLSAYIFNNLVIKVLTIA